MLSIYTDQPAPRYKKGKVSWIAITIGGIALNTRGVLIIARKGYKSIPVHISVLLARSEVYQFRYYIRVSSRFTRTRSSNRVRQ